MKKITLLAAILIALMTTVSAASYKDALKVAPPAGSASEFYLNFIKAIPSMTEEEFAKHFTKNAFIRSLSPLKASVANIDFSKANKYKEKDLGNGLFSVRLNFKRKPRGGQGFSKYLKKVDGKWLFADSVRDANK